ncbi:cytosine/adenosine deaminase-related metal-dependent hydrolase [Bradyrhizobium sp. RT6a]|jgi:cytosine/adenosine deaminase-related metal-dependent hydrolase
MVTEIAATSLFRGLDRGVSDNVVLRHDGGVITDVSEGAGPTSGPRSFVIPAFVNAHDHARVTASSFGAVGMPLESWILRTALGTPVDPYLTAASALARSAKAGCAAMMVHYTRPSGTMPMLEEAKVIARAASNVGIRIAFALAVRDQNPIVYGDAEPVLAGLSRDDRKTIEDLFVRVPMSPKAYIEMTDAIAAAITGPMVDVQLGPPACNGARSRSLKPLPRTRCGPAAASTCTCWRPCISAPGRTRTFPTWCDGCATSASSPSG